MYELYGHGPVMAEDKGRECKPDYELMAAKAKKDLKVVEDFRYALLQFVSVIRPSFKSGPSSLFELLGTLDFDIRNRHDNLAKLLEKIESAG